MEKSGTIFLETGGEPNTDCTRFHAPGRRSISPRAAFIKIARIFYGIINFGTVLRRVFTPIHPVFFVDVSAIEGNKKGEESVRAATIFSGGGGSEIGLQSAGFEIAWAIEKEANIASVHSINFPKCRTLIADARNVNPEDLEPVDWLHASPPCQQFSSARRNTTKLSPERDAGIEIVRFAEALKPGFISIENVQDYASTEYFQHICDRLREIGYGVSWAILNAHNFGVAQDRKRLFLVACKFSLVDLEQIPWQEDKPGWYRAISDLIPFLPDDGLAAWQKPYVHKIRHRPIMILRGGANVRNPAIRQAHEPSPTIRAFALWGGSNWSNLVLSNSVRRMTPRATARLQGIPDSYRLPEKVGLAQTIIGNAVPPPLMKAIANYSLQSS